MLLCVWQDARVWAHWNDSFHIHLSYLGSVSCVFHILPRSSVLTRGSRGSLMATRQQVLFSFLSALQAQKFMFGGPESPMVVTSLLLTWQEILHFSVYVYVQACSTLCNPMDCSPPGSSVQGIFQARILEWVAISYSRNLLDPGIEPASPAPPVLVGRFFTTSATWETISQGLD